MTQTPSIPIQSRFSNRADNYVKYRPGYPNPVFDLLENLPDLDRDTPIVDIGSGTGLFAEPFLERGFAVTGIEPDGEMRRAAEHRLAKYPKFNSLARTGGDTGLLPSSTDLVTIAQTFHWLNAEQTRKECQLILRPGGHVVLAWNRQLEESQFEKDYTVLREKYRLEPASGRVIDIPAIESFYKTGTVVRHVFPNPQPLNFESLKGHLLSKTYSPLPGHDSYEPMINELIRLFVNSNVDGVVTLQHETVVYVGQPA